MVPSMYRLKLPQYLAPKMWFGRVRTLGSHASVWDPTTTILVQLHGLFRGSNDLVRTREGVPVARDEALA